MPSALRSLEIRISAPLPRTVRRDFRRSQEMVHQPTNRNDEQMLFAGVQPPVKNTFLHYDVCASAYQVEQQVLRRHQTAPAKSARDVSDVETDSEDEGVTVPKVLGTVNELKTIVAVNDVTLNLLTKEDYPMPGSLCRHTTHDAFEHGQVAWEPTVFGQGEFEGHQNGMNGQALQEGLQWDGQMGGQTCGVLPMTSDTVMFVGVHPPVWMPPDDASFSGQGALPIHPGMDCSNVSMIPLIMQPPLPQPIDADSTMAADQMVAVTGEWANYYPAEKYELLPQQLQVAPTEVIPEVFDVQSFSNPFGNFVQPDVKCLHPGGVSESERFWDGLGVELLHQPQKIGRSANMDNVYWVVDATKLNDKAKVLVSPEFKIPGRDGSQGSFKMVMYPKDKSSFRQAGGQGFVQLKCESDTQDLQSCSLTFRMGICNGRSGELAKRDGPRNVVTWDFKKSLVCDDEEVKKIWNFKEVVDAKTRTFAVCIEILSVEA